ncbi:male sterility protein-domain-containing protein [Xylariaceae sp. FL0662B]|nr:male sterility protein-domain-containing protein [Xylariaceae sp. FL0662B]
MHLSEEDFHQIIAEGILLESARRDGNYTDTELTTGLLSVASDVTDRPIWFMDPKFFHLILAYDKQVDDFDQGSITDGNTGANAKLMTISAVRDRLHSSRTPREVDTIVTEAFATLLRYELQIKSTSDDDLMQMHSDELGVDSLVAVDIRNWFLKSLCVSIPVLRIMGKGNMTSLVQHAIENIPSEMIPQVAWESLKPHENEKQEASRDTATYRTVYNHNTNSQSTIPLDVPGTFIDWAAETQPPTTSDDLLELLQSHSTYTEAAVFPPKVIVITGSTGLLGGHLLSYLLQVSLPTTKIIGISVRRLRTIDIHTFLAGLPLDIRAAAASGRVSFLAGDLSQPRLGLSPADCAASFAAADVVIHAGADTSHIKPYADLRETNVGSVAELVRLCAVRKGVSLHFVSSAGVGLFSANDESDQMLPERAPGTPPAADGEGILAHSGYLASKWAGERLLERAASAGKLHVWIHRPSTIVRQGIDAREDQARFDWLNQLVLYVCATRTIPEVKHARGALDLVYVDNVCEEIAKHALQCPRAGIPIISYVHEVGDIVVPLDRLEDLLEVDLKIDTVNGPLDEEQANPKLSVRDNPSDTSFVRLSMSRWIEMAVGRGLHPAVAALIEAMDRPDTPIFLRIKKGNSSNPNGLSEPEGT